LEFVARTLPAYKPKYDFTILIRGPIFRLHRCATASDLYPRQDGPSRQRYRLIQSLTTMHPSAPRRTITDSRRRASKVPRAAIRRARRKSGPPYALPDSSKLTGVPGARGGFPPAAYLLRFSHHKSVRLDLLVRPARRNGRRCRTARPAIPRGARHGRRGAPRIHGELLKLGLAVAQSSVAKYMVKRRGPPSQGWRTFLHNHAPDMAAVDLFVVPTIGFKLLYAFVIVRLNRRDLVWINVATNPRSEWVARQITEAFPWNEAPRYMIRDRDRIYGAVVTRRLRAMGIRDKPIAPASPWQNGFAERLIGSIRHECLDHVIIRGEAHLRRILRSYAMYYNKIRTHRSLDKDAPIWRPVQRTGVITSNPILGGLHHHYIRI
jgi:transposase InsO family protein